jgi:RimJ/RimL family protein N-acetyltransferase
MGPEDAVPLLDLFGDPGFMAVFEQEPFDRAAMDAWLERNLEHQRQHGFGLWTVVETRSGQVVGDCGLERMELDGAIEWELGYDIRRDVWGRGLATEAAEAVVRFAFETLTLPRLVSLVRSSNGSSARVAKKIGMIAERELTRSGTEYTLYALTAD